MTYGIVAAGNDRRAAARLSLAVIYILAGLLHLARPDLLLLIMPSLVPFPRETIFVTGILEFAGAVALLSQRLRQAAGLAFALYAVCVYPANIKHAIDSLTSAHAMLGWWYHLPRLAFQPILVWWALYAGNLVRWPIPRRQEAENNELKIET